MNYLPPGARFERARVKDFGNEQDRALRATMLVPLLAHGPLRLTGADRLDFVHGQISNEVKRLEVGQCRQALMLNHKGHALAQLWVFRREEDLFLAVEGGAGKLVEAQLKAHIIFDQVELQNLTGTISSFSLQGERAAALLQEVFATELPAENHFVHLPFAGAKVLMHPSRRSLAMGFDLHVLTKDAAQLFNVLQDYGAVPAGEKALELARIEAGIAAVETEAGEGVLPQEAGLEHAVSYQKGCYLGQEIMARIEARGNLRRSLQGLMLEAMPDSAMREISLEGKVVGRLGAVAEHPELGIIALSVLRNDLDEAAVLKIGDISARRCALPFRGVG
jgi:hypothetical protein